jgi:hypothetical protein
MDNSAWRGFFWIPTRQITVSSIKLLMYRSGTPGTLNFHFKPCHMKNGTNSPPEVYTWNILATASTDGDSLPTGSPYEWREFVLSTPVTVVPGMGYVFWGTKKERLALPPHKHLRFICLCQSPCPGYLRRLLLVRQVSAV